MIQRQSCQRPHPCGSRAKRAGLQDQQDHDGRHGLDHREMGRGRAAAEVLGRPGDAPGVQPGQAQRKQARAARRHRRRRSGRKGEEEQAAGDKAGLPSIARAGHDGAARTGRRRRAGRRKAAGADTTGRCASRTAGRAGHWPRRRSPDARRTFPGPRSPDRRRGRPRRRRSPRSASSVWRLRVEKAGGSTRTQPGAAETRPSRTPPPSLLRVSRQVRLWPRRRTPKSTRVSLRATCAPASSACSRTSLRAAGW